MINTQRLRKWLGYLGMLLPIIVLVMSVAYGYPSPDSISATYFIDTCIVPFMIILGSAGILLMSYQGYDKQDDIICTIAGVCGWLICLFPCDLSGTLTTELIGTFAIPATISGIIHNISAIIFFLLLAYNSLFLFTKTSGNITESKKKRNIIFRVCGIGMIMALVGIIPITVFKISTGTWWIETIALLFFGISWLTKSNIYTWLFAEK